MKDSISYQINLKHEDFILLLDSLRKSQEQGVVTWSLTSFLCEHTKVIEL